MNTSAAAIVKAYLERYICVNLVKTQQQRYIDYELARKTLSISYDIVHEMEELIRSNNANDYPIIKQSLRKKVSVMRDELRGRQSLLERCFQKTSLPADFDRCIQEAWSKLQDFERHNGVEQPKVSNFSRRF